MATKLRTFSRVPSPKTAESPAEPRERLQADALAEVAQVVEADCRIQPKSYLDEVRVPAAGE